MYHFSCSFALDSLPTDLNCLYSKFLPRRRVPGYVFTRDKSFVRFDAFVIDERHGKDRSLRLSLQATSHEVHVRDVAFAPSPLQPHFESRGMLRIGSAADAIHLTVPRASAVYTPIRARPATVRGSLVLRLALLQVALVLLLSQTCILPVVAEFT